jgi:hypothetical protein
MKMTQPAPTLIDSIPEIPPSLNTQQPQEQLKKSKTELTEIQENLNGLIDAMAKNSSILERGTTFWGNRPLWQKILLGIVLIPPPLIIGILASSVILVTLSIFTLITYITGSLILDDHYRKKGNNTKNLKIGILNLATILENVIFSLDKISGQLTQQLNEFAEENIQLKENIHVLGTRNHALTQEIDKIRATANKLQQTENELKEACNHLKCSLTKQTQLLENSQAALKTSSEEHQQTQQQLAETVRELNDRSTGFAQKIEEYDQMVILLNDSLTKVIEAQKTAPEAQASLDKTLQAFGEQHNLMRNSLAEVKLKEVSQSLDQATQLLELSNQEQQISEQFYKEKLTKFKQHITYQEAQITQLTSRLGFFISPTNAQNQPLIEVESPSLP